MTKINIAPSHRQTISELSKQIEKYKAHFLDLYNSSPSIIVRSPGRAEIIGNHTDYNHGYALSCAISDSIYALFRKREDTKVNVYSSSFPTEKPLSFKIDKKIPKDKKMNWINYVKGVIQMLVLSKYKVRGADIFIEGTVPTSGGVSSSAALELAIAYGMLKLGKNHFEPLEIAHLCQKAENEYVNSPCGFLDQGSVTFAQNDYFVFMDFLPKKTYPVSDVRLIPADLDEYNSSFVLAYDGEVKRELGSSGYPERRKMCEDSLPHWSKILGRKISSLRDISVEDYKEHKEQIEKINPTMKKRVEHVVYENQRVLDAVYAIENHQIENFGQLLTESGESALKLYDLDDKTPELTFLFENAKKLKGVLGVRNMGGGFSALILALILNDHIDDFKTNLAKNYISNFKGGLKFIQFEASDGVETLDI